MSDRSARKPETDPVVLALAAMIRVALKRRAKMTVVEQDKAA